MADRESIKADFGKAAAGYDTHAALQRRVRQKALALAADYLPGGTQVLDIGCGTGALAQESDMHGWQAAGVDLSPGMCAQARQAMRLVAAADAQALPFADETFGGIFSSLMLQWAERPSPVLREMRRVLKPGGYAVVTTLVDGTLKELAKAFAELDDSPRVAAFIEPGMLPPALVHAGFILLEMKEERIVEHYPDARAVMRAIKSIGASNKHVQRPRGLLTPRRLERAARAYPGGGRKGVPASWHVVTLLLTRN